jgi:hypothetical protein
METSSQKPSFGQGLELAMLIEKAIANAVKKTNADSDKVQERMIGKPGVIYKFFEDLLADEAEQKSSMLKLISGGEKIMIEALDGKATITDAKKTFVYIDSDFKGWGLNKKGEATKETPIQPYELVQDANFAKIFSSFANLDEACFTQAQIIRFCEKYPRQLRQEGYGNFFLLKMDGEYFVALVDVHSDGLKADVGRFDIDDVWSAECRHRVFVPATCTLAT